MFSLLRNHAGLSLAYRGLKLFSTQIAREMYFLLLTHTHTCSIPIPFSSSSVHSWGRDKWSEEQEEKLWETRGSEEGRAFTEEASKSKGRWSGEGEAYTHKSGKTRRGGEEEGPFR